MADIRRARRLRKQETWAEKLVWRWLRDRRFNGYKFRRQFPFGSYNMDFFCMEARLAIELDGLGHGHPERRLHDARRDEALARQGIKVLRFWNSSLRRNAEGIRDAIFRELQARAPIHKLPPPPLLPNAVSHITTTPTKTNGRALFPQGLCFYGWKLLRLMVERFC
jgi:very-short-patch-repair endonuclease